MDYKDFDKKYKVSKADKDYLRFTKIDQNIASLQVVGKPTKLWKDVLKRFFKNPLSLSATIIFSLILITAVATWIFSPYQTGKAISPVDYAVVNSQRPSWYGYIQMSATNDLLLKIRKLEAENNITLIKGIATEVAPNRLQFVANPYEIMAWMGKAEDVKVPSMLFSIAGTDQFGRDIWLRTWIGTLNALGIAIIIAIIETFIGITLGIYLGFHVGKWIDTILLRIIEIFSSIPWLIIFIIFVGMFGSSPIVLILLLSLTGWTGPTYQARLFTITVKDEEFIQASKSVGASKLRLMYSHVLPNISGKLASSFVARIVSGISVISGLAFLGFVKEELTSTPNLGLILNSSRALVSENVWALALPTAILLTLALSTRFMANGIHDALDPKVGGKR